MRIFGGEDRTIQLQDWSAAERNMSQHQHDIGEGKTAVKEEIIKRLRDYSKVKLFYPTQLKVDSHFYIEYRYV